ncbi:MAG: hypothetical protein WC374_05640 [Phycisphaerae bacterium]|jgi:hypothetical protein
MNIFIDEDMAYLFGLVVGRGSLKDGGGLKQIIISFPFRSLAASGVHSKIIQKDKILISLDSIVNRIGELAGDFPRKIQTQSTVDIVIDFHKNNLLWRNLKALSGDGKSYMDIEIPPVIYSSSEVIKKEFIRGMADVTAYARSGNVYRDGRHRIYFEIHNANWKLPVELCLLLQTKPLCIPVQTIDWGHPNIRNGHAKEYDAGRKTAWAREHQLKIFADDFESIGFRIEHKNIILKEMAEYNRIHYPSIKQKLCTPPKKIIKQKIVHPEEKSKRLPQELCGKHFDTYWQVCKDIGCTQFNPVKNEESDAS